MKCPRCRALMRREKYSGGYRYVCPACSLVIGGGNDRNKEEA